MNKLKDLLETSKRQLKKLAYENPEENIDDLVFDVVTNVLPALPSENLDLVRHYGKNGLEELREKLIITLQKECDKILSEIEETTGKGEQYG